VSKREHEVRLPDRFWRHSTHLSLDAKGIYSILLTFIDYRTCETLVGNYRLERESGFGRDKVKGLISELEAKGFIERKRLFVGNLKSKRILRCLKFVSMGGFSAQWTDRRFFGQPEIKLISEPSHSSEPSQSHQSNSSLPPPEPENPEGSCD
jgi:hypothetical protein